MKKGLVFLALLATLITEGKPISEKTAKAVAETYIGVGNSTRAGETSVQLSIRGICSTAPLIFDTPAYYAYNISGGGFVIVSGDDVARPVLAYSTVGEIDPNNLSACLKDWLDQYAKVIESVSSKGLTPSRKTIDEWSTLMNGEQPERGQDVILETASWDQWWPFNLMCPKVNDQECPSGCVNTACAIIMKYYAHPQSGTGKVGNYYYVKDDNYYTVPEEYELGHIYDWENMPAKYIGGECTQYQAEQVAQLMKDLGFANKTQYMPNESGAYIKSAVKNLTNKFDYDQSVTCYNHSHVLDSKWNELIHNEIDNKRLVLISGFDGHGSRHAYLVCGYSGDYYCFNLGWGGGSTTFALMSPVDGYDEELIEYYKGQCAFINVMPNAGGEKPVLDYILVENLGETNWAYQTDGYFFIEGSGSYFNYYGTEDVTGTLELAYALIDNEYNVKEILSEKIGTVTREERQGHYDLGITCHAPSSYCPTDYFALCFRKPGESAWRVADHLPGAMIPLRYDGKIEDAVKLTVRKKNDLGKYTIHVDKPKSVAIEIIRDDGLMDGSRYAYVYPWQSGNNEPTWLHKSECLYRYWQGDGHNLYVYDNHKKKTYTITFYDSEKSYTVQMEL